MTMTKLITTRRTVLVGAGALGLLIGVGAWRLTQKGPSLAGTTDASGAFLNDWIHVGRDGFVTLRTGQSEMGQGAFTGVATLVAEELGCGLGSMRVETGPASSVFKNIAVGRDALAPNHGLAKGPPEGIGGKVFDFVVEAATQQVTGGSSTIINGFDRARIVGAVAREMLVAAAAKQWGVAASDCAVKDGAVIHAVSKRQLGFGELAEAAAKETPPSSVSLKPREKWTLIGAPKTQRVDIPEKVDGSARFGIDMRRPGMLFAAIANCPEFGGSVDRVDDAKAAKMPGVAKIVPLDNAVAVVADTSWRAKAALAALQISWKNGPAAKLDSDAIGKSLASAVGGAGKVEAEGDFAASYAGAAKKLSADYTLPYLAHAAMEPINCTAEVSPDRVEVWAPTQAQTINVDAAAAAAGVSADKVNLHTTYLGGGFGRRAESDYVIQAVKVAKAVGKPVQVIWSREEDMTHDFYRPAAIVRVDGGLDGAGKLVALRFATVSQSILARMFPPAVWLGPDFTQFEGTVSIPYSISGKRTELAVIDAAVPVGTWRSVGHSITAFAKESFVDEMAHEAGADPLQFRLNMLGDQPRLSALLKLVADKAGWATPLPKGQGRGLALHTSFQTAVAEVVEVTTGDKGALKVDRVVAAVDCGTMVNPDIVTAQVASGIIYGLSAALFGKITIKNGAVQQQNFPDYDVVHMAQAPRIEVHLTPSEAPPGGIGEPGLPPLAPALANAIFAATGKRIRSLPLADQGFVA
jgi:isoquinoline 1-oxidoreductase beta subunit